MLINTLRICWLNITEIYKIHNTRIKTIQFISIELTTETR